MKGYLLLNPAEFKLLLEYKNLAGEFISPTTNLDDATIALRDKFISVTLQKALPLIISYKDEFNPKYIFTDDSFSIITDDYEIERKYPYRQYYVLEYDLKRNRTVFIHLMNKKKIFLQRRIDELNSPKELGGTILGFVDKVELKDCKGIISLEKSDTGSWKFIDKNK